MILALSAGRDSPIDLRARIALDEDGQRALLRSPRPRVGELAVLCTCHRTEVYFTAEGLDRDAVHVVAGILPALQPTDHHDLRFMEGSEAIEHLFRVACGLDSLAIGEPQVLGQVRRAYVLARDEEAAGPVLSNIFGRAIRLGRQVRAETALGRLGRSIGSVAADHLVGRLGDLRGRRGAVVGAGEAAADAARWLWKAGASITVVSRATASASRLAQQFGGTAHPVQELSMVLDGSDFAVVAVSGGIAVRREDIPERSSERPLLLLDLSMPRGVENCERPGAELLTLEDITAVPDLETTDAIIDAEAMVKKEVAILERWLDTRASGPAIRDLRARAETVVREEVARGLAGLDLPAASRERVAALGMRIASKLLHGPITGLRDADEATRATIKRLFGLEP